MRRFLFGLLAALVAVVLVGCEDLLDHEWTFKNRSSYDVRVDPSGGQDWNGFTLGRDQERDVEYDSSSIKYSYSPSNKVYPDDDSESNTIIFRNR